MVELNTPIEKIIQDNRSVHRLNEQGYQTYYDIKDLTLDQLREIPGMGEVSAQRVYLDIESIKKSTYEAVIKSAMALADRVGVERAIEIMDTVE